MRHALALFLLAAAIPGRSTGVPSRATLLLPGRYQPVQTRWLVPALGAASRPAALAAAAIPAVLAKGPALAVQHGDRLLIVPERPKAGSRVAVVELGSEDGGAKLATLSRAAAARLRKALPQDDPSAVYAALARIFDRRSSQELEPASRSARPVDAADARSTDEVAEFARKIALEQRYWDVQKDFYKRQLAHMSGKIADRRLRRAIPGLVAQLRVPQSEPPLKAVIAAVGRKSPPYVADRMKEASPDGQAGFKLSVGQSGLDRLVKEIVRRELAIEGLTRLTGADAPYLLEVSGTFKRVLPILRDESVLHVGMFTPRDVVEARRRRQDSIATTVLATPLR